jgi:zinc/manganese transport system permease protein
LISGFIDSWWLFHNSYLTGWLIGILLSLVGVLVVARDQIFIGAAVSQASMLGISLGMLLGTLPLLEPCTWCESEAFLSITGGVFAVFGALLTTSAGGLRRESPEAITGWVFLLSASLAIVLMAHSPHGLEEIHRLQSSTLIGAVRSDVVLFLVLVGVTLAACVLALPRLMLLIMDPEMAATVGMRVALWNRAVSVWLGVAVGVSMRVSGMVYTFGCLVLPALVAKSLCREVRSLFLVAPIIAVGGSLVAFVLANHYDLPPGQVAAALLAALVLAAWCTSRLRGT